MMTIDEIKSAALDELQEELAEAGWDIEHDIDEARDAVQALIEDLYGGPSLDDWLDGWENAVLDGQSHISRAEAVRRWMAA